MADYLFVSQDMIDSWLMEGKIDFSGTVMSIRGEQRSYNLEPAVRFVRVSGDEADGPGLVAKVKTLDQVAELGGEHYHDSVVMGDVAYDVQNGFIARIHLPEAGAVEAATAPGAEAAAAKPEGRPAKPYSQEKPEASAAGPAPSAPVYTAGNGDENDEALLTRFLLENLR